MLKPFSALVIVAAGSLGLGGPWTALADDPRATEAEIALIPEWCKRIMTKDGSGTTSSQEPQVRAKIYDLQSSGCGGIHHFCWALIWANRGYFRSYDSQYPLAHLYGSAIDDMKYVFDHSRSGKCKLFPEMHTKTGELKLLLDRQDEAEESFRKALAIKPSYAPAYIGLSDLYEAQGAAEKAIEVLQAGIKANPKSSALQKKLKRVQQRSAGPSASP